MSTQEYFSPVSRYDVYLKKDESTLTVGLWNLHPDKIKNAAFKIGIPYKSVSFFDCGGHEENGKIILDTIVYPYEFAAFELKI